MKPYDVITRFLALVFLLFVPLSFALADPPCRKIDFTVSNNIGAEIRIYRVRWYDLDDSKWRTNNIPNIRIPAGGTTVFRETLDHMRDKPVGVVNIEYKRLQGNHSRAWSRNQIAGIGDCSNFEDISHNIRTR